MFIVAHFEDDVVVQAKCHLFIGLYFEAIHWPIEAELKACMLMFFFLNTILKSIYRFSVFIIKHREQ